MQTSKLLNSKGEKVEQKQLKSIPSFITSSNKTNNKKIAALLRGKDGNQETNTKTRV
jgi:hypothetical protein